MPAINPTLWIHGVPVTNENDRYTWSPEQETQVRLQPCVSNDLIRPMTLLTVRFTPAVEERDNWFIIPSVTVGWDNTIVGEQAMRIRIEDKKPQLPSGIAVYHREYTMFYDPDNPKTEGVTFVLMVRAWK